MYQINSYNRNNFYALTTYNNINTSLICINHYDKIYLTQLLKGSEYIRFINSIYRINTIDNIVLILLKLFNSLLSDINNLFRVTKPFDNHINLVLLPYYKHSAIILTFVYPTLESILFHIEEKYKSSLDIQFKHIYITLSLTAYIHNTSMVICQLLQINNILLKQNY
jgi:hypothetical protein